jgi:hypothetical protein
MPPTGALRPRALSHSEVSGGGDDRVNRDLVAHRGHTPVDRQRLHDSEPASADVGDVSRLDVRPVATPAVSHPDPDTGWVGGPPQPDCVVLAWRPKWLGVANRIGHQFADHEHAVFDDPGRQLPPGQVIAHQVPRGGNTARLTRELGRSASAARVDRWSAHGGSLRAGGPSPRTRDGPDTRVVPADPTGKPRSAGSPAPAPAA